MRSCLYSLALAVVLTACSGGPESRPSYIVAGGSAPADLLGKRYQLGVAELRLRYVGSITTSTQPLVDEPSLNRQFFAFMARELQTQGIASDRAGLLYNVTVDYGRRLDVPPIVLYSAEVFDNGELIAEHISSSVEQAGVLLQQVEPNSLAERQQLADIARAIVKQLASVSQ